jgi:hypothetical protein
MKKLYLKPHTKVSQMAYDMSLLGVSRETAGGPTETGGVSPGINDRDENSDPFHKEDGSGAGQGSGGGGNRSKAYQVWEY